MYITVSLLSVFCATGMANISLMSSVLYLSYNQLTTLPESFGSVKVGGDLKMGRRLLHVLPASLPGVKGDIEWRGDM